MKKALLLTVSLAALAACTSTTALSPTLVQDGTLTVAALQVLSADAATLGAPPADVAAVNLAATAVQTALTDLQKGSTTPQAFATLATDEINAVAPTILRDVKANPTITTGVTLLTNFIPIIAADVAAQTTAPTAAAIDNRSGLQAWVTANKK